LAGDFGAGYQKGENHMAFRKATFEGARLKVALYGPSGSGKTYTALQFAAALGGKIAVIDTEHGSASKYADLCEFDVCDDLPDFHPGRITKLIDEAAESYDVIVIDSLSHAWQGKGGMLDLQSAEVERSRSGNTFQAWGKVGHHQNRMIESIIKCPAHVLCTMRTKTAYETSKNEKGGMEIKKLGLDPVQRQGVEYEFDVLCELDQANNITVIKSRFSDLHNQQAWRPDGAFLKPILERVGGGTPLSKPKKVQPCAAEREFRLLWVDVPQDAKDTFTLQKKEEGLPEASADWTEADWKRGIALLKGGE
jgi:hypothetical protein